MIKILEIDVRDMTSNVNALSSPDGMRTLTSIILLFNILTIVLVKTILFVFKMCFFFQNLISRNYRGDISSNSIEKFLPLVLEQEEESVPTPIVVWGNVTFVYIKCNNLYIVATTKINANAALIFTFLHRLTQVLS